MDHVNRFFLRKKKIFLLARSFLFQLYPIKKIWKSTGINDHYQYLNHSTETLFNGVGQGGQIKYKN